MPTVIRSLRLAIAAAIVLAGMLVASPPASAAPIAGTTVYFSNCSLTAGYAVKSGSYIKGAGRYACGSATNWKGRLRVQIQRHRWCGWSCGTVSSYLSSYYYRPFEIVRSAPNWNCSGSGTYTYKVVAYGEDYNVVTGAAYTHAVSGPTSTYTC
jgi:hypothetical protein